VCFANCFFQAKAQVNYDSLENNLANYLQNDTTKVYLLTDLAKSYLQNAVKVDTAKMYVDEALDLAQSLKNLKALAYALDAKGVYERSTARYYTAIYYHEQALEIAKQLKDKYLIIVTNNNIGVAYRRMGDTASALPYHLKALELSKESNDIYNITYALNCLGNLYYQTNELEKALQHFRQAQKLDLKINNLLGLAINMNNVGGIFRKRGNYDSAMLYYEKSLELNTKIRNIKGISICYDDLGVTYSLLKDYEKALHYLKKALQIAYASKDIIYVARIYMHIGTAYLDREDPQKAMYYLTKSIAMANEIKAKGVVQESYEELSRAHNQLGDYKQSLEYYQIAMRYKDTLTNDEKTKQMAYLQAKFENEQKDIQIKVLKQENALKEADAFMQKVIGITLVAFLAVTLFVVLYLMRENKAKFLKNKQLQTQQRDLMQQKNEIQQQKDELDRVNLVKDRLFSIIGHDLRSPFNTIKGFIAVLRVGGLNEEETKNITSTIEQQLNSTLNLLNNLLYWSWSQMQGITANPIKLSVNPIVENNIELLLQSALKKNIFITHSIDKQLCVKADENMLDTIIRNLLANAIKFTYHGGSVVFSYQDNNDHYVFCVADTGVGMTENQLQNLFGAKASSTFGTAQEKGTGLGLQICKEFLEKNKGTLWVESELNKGSKFYFSLPKV
jgi:signal transduction histidine kinase/uncharacterized protein HemY